MSLLNVGSLALIEILGDFSLEKYAHGEGLHYLGLGGIGYIGVVYFLIRSLRESNILFVNNAWDAISSLIETIAAVVLLGERFASLWQYFGIIMILMGIFLIKYTGSGSKNIVEKMIKK
jgi:multidrug transporter EmrE-like cation transporter